jgi:ubiquitin-protein ligase
MSIDDDRTEYYLVTFHLQFINIYHAQVHLAGSVCLHVLQHRS